MNPITEIHYLRHCSADNAFHWLKSRRFVLESCHEHPKFFTGQPKGSLEVLYHRDDPLIRLGIALYGHNTDILSLTFQNALECDSDPLICACLENSYVACVFPFFIGHIDDWEPIKILITKPHAMHAIVENDWIPDELIDRIIKREGVFEDLEDELHLELIKRLKNNASFLGSLDYVYDKDLYPGPSPWYAARKAFHDLLNTLPVTGASADAVTPVINELIQINQYYVRGSNDESCGRKLLKRWDKLENKKYVLPMMKTLLALLYLPKNQALLKEKDDALREAFYRGFEPYEFGYDFEEYIDSSDPIAFNMVFNRSLWRNSDAREKMLQIVEDAQSEDVYELTQQINTKRAISEEYETKYPEWFKSDKAANEEARELRIVLSKIDELSDELKERFNEAEVSISNQLYTSGEQVREKIASDSENLVEEIESIKYQLEVLQNTVNVVKAKAMTTKKGLFG